MAHTAQFSQIYIGDETRLYQAVSNLVSNALKFSHPHKGQSVVVRTQLLYPTLADQIKQAALDEASDETAVEKPSIGGTDYTLGEKAVPAPSSTAVGSQTAGQRRRDMAVVRVEVTDTGVGIRPRDLEQNQLFTAYAQVRALRPARLTLSRCLDRQRGSVSALVPC